ncbi:MAG: major facilitator superfamily protein [Phycisphaerales bacterium]|nr:major facilitator superfamily protein [Phycisphaerales bacterium]
MGRVTMAWMFGAVWANALAGAPLTVFATQLGTTNFEFGLLAAMPFLAALLSLPASVLADRSGQRSRLFFLGLYPNRLLWIVVALVPPWVLTHAGKHGSVLAVLIFLSLIFVINIGQAVGSPGWNSWMADIVPIRVRGRYFARRRQLGIPSAIIAAFVSGWVLDHYRVADAATLIRVCSGIFIVAALFGVMDIATFHGVPHAVRKVSAAPILSTLGRPLRNRRFVWFSLGASILWFAVAGQAQFVNKYLVDQLQLKSMQVQLIVLVGPLLAQLLVLPVWGRTIDRYGKKPAMLIATLGLVPVGAGWILVESHHLWTAYVLAMIGSVLWTGVDVANFNLVIELSGTDPDGKSGGTAYTAVNSVIVNIAGCLGGLFFGTVAEKLQGQSWQAGLAKPVTYYEIIFAVSAVLRLVAVFPMLKMKEPEAEPTLDALRFIAGSLYNNVVGAVTLPGRLFVRESSEEEST